MGQLSNRHKQWLKNPAAKTGNGETGRAVVAKKPGVCSLGEAEV